ncbi:MAG: membrane protein insertase YidC, partial [Candidatus Poribacteria bacterium]
MDRKTLIAIAISFLILVLWQKIIIEPRVSQGIHASPSASPVPSNALLNDNNLNSASQYNEKMLMVEKQSAQQSLRQVSIQTGTGPLSLSNGNSLITNWQLKDYHTEINKNSALVDLTLITNNNKQFVFAFDDPHLSYLETSYGTLKSEPTGGLFEYEDQNIRLTKHVVASENQQYLDVAIMAQFKTKKPKYAFLSLFSHGTKDDQEAQDRQIVYWTNNDLERILVQNVSKQTDVATTVKYIGTASRYFLLSVINRGLNEPRALIQPMGPLAARVSLVYPIIGDSIEIPVRVYFGPKNLESLRSAEPLLDHTVDFGWFTVFAYPLLRLLKWFYTFAGNYGVSIILLTLLLKIVTYPLTLKSMKSMKEMAKIQPQIQKLREKFKDDKEKLNKEMLILMRSHGYNPMAGCLPILIQMPIFFALYRVLYSSIELYHAPFALWVTDLSSRDPYYVTPVLLSITMYIQQKLTPTTATDPTQARMMQFMP